MTCKQPNVGALPERGEVLRIGAEPLSYWGEDEDSGLPRFHLLVPGWRFRLAGDECVKLGKGMGLSATIEKWDGEQLVPSSHPPDFESRGMWIAGFTLAELRAIRISQGEGWVSLRARLWWFWRVCLWRCRGYRERTYLPRFRGEH